MVLDPGRAVRRKPDCIREHLRWRNPVLCAIGRVDHPQPAPEASDCIALLSASFFFVSAYLYLIVVGRNIPLWVYAFVVGMLGYGAYSTVKKIRREAAAK